MSINVRSRTCFDPRFWAPGSSTPPIGAHQYCWPDYALLFRGAADAYFSRNRDHASRRLADAPVGAIGQSLWV